MKKIMILISLLGIIIIFYIIIKPDSIKQIKYYYLEKIYGQPIDIETGIINNDFFNIDSTGKECVNTTKGINEAILYANKNNIEYIKLEHGSYLINGIRDSKGIELKSNITFDCGGATLQEITNDQIGYCVFYLNEVENVKIINGIIKGDKNTHNYDNISSTHEWGSGIVLLGCINIEIHNLEIYNFTGDGIYISGSEVSNGSRLLSKNISIENNNVHHCRRQGISIITGDTIEIKDNEIHDIRWSFATSWYRYRKK